MELEKSVIFAARGGLVQYVTRNQRFSRSKICHLAWILGQIDGFGALPTPRNPKTMRQTKYWQSFSRQEKKFFFQRSIFRIIFWFFRLVKKAIFTKNPLSICIGFPIETVRPKSLSDRFFENGMSKVRRNSGAPGQTE